ncbi:MAG: MFS transporter [Sphaerobacter sp.]|nr:MFS transporter [Sphaerobacter sp.]
MHRVSDLGAWYRRNRILAWVCAVIAVNQLGFGSIVPVVPLYAETFGVSQALIGLTIAVYGLARFLAAVPAGRIADGPGRRWTLALGGGVTVLGNLLCAVAPTYPLFLAARFVAGAGAAMVLTGGQIILADITTQATRGRTMAIYQSVFLFAVGVGPLPGGVMAEYGGLAFPFYAYAAVGSVVALLTLARLPETKGLRAGVGATARPPFAQQVRLLTATPAFLLVSLVAFGNAFARTGALFNLVPTLAQSRIGLSESQIGLGLALVSIGGLAVAYPSGLLVDRFGRKAVIVPATLLSATALALFSVAPNFAWYLVSCSVWAAASGVSGAAPAAYAADVAPPGMNAAAMGAFRMLADAGYVVGPALLGWTADLVGTNASLYGTALLLAACGLSFARFAPETYAARATAAGSGGADVVHRARCR